MLLNFSAYWLAALPLAWYLGIYLGHGPQAVWVGLIVGLGLTAFLLNLRFTIVSRRALAATPV
jgi:MATE family multidrug resistance protein